MRKFFPIGRTPDGQEVDKSVANIEAEVFRVTNEIDELEKKIRIETKVGEDLREEFNQFIVKEEEFDRQKTELHREEQNLRQGIEEKKKYADSLTKSISDSTELINHLDAEIRRKDKYYSDQLQRMEAAKQKHMEIYRKKAAAYESLNNTLNKYNISSRKQLSAKERREQKQKNFEALEMEVEALERKLKELDEKKAMKEKMKESKKKEENSMMNENLFADPYKVIVRIAEIKLGSMQMQNEIKTVLEEMQLMQQEQMDTQSVKDQNSQTIVKETGEEVQIIREIVKGNAKDTDNEVQIIKEINRSPREVVQKGDEPKDNDKPSDIAVSNQKGPEESESPTPSQTVKQVVTQMVTFAQQSSDQSISPPHYPPTNEQNLTFLDRGLVKSPESDMFANAIQTTAVSPPNTSGQNQFPFSQSPPNTNDSKGNGFNLFSSQSKGSSESADNANNGQSIFNLFAANPSNTQNSNETSFNFFD